VANHSAHPSLTHPWYRLAAVMLQKALDQRHTSAWPAHPAVGPFAFARDIVLSFPHCQLTACAEQRRFGRKSRSPSPRPDADAQHWNARNWGRMKAQFYAASRSSARPHACATAATLAKANGGRQTPCRSLIADLHGCKQENHRPPRTRSLDGQA
jgi:hypothetical protein